MKESDVASEISPGKWDVDVEGHFLLSFHLIIPQIEFGLLILLKVVTSLQVVRCKHEKYIEVIKR